LLIASDELLLDELIEYIQDYIIKKESSWLKQNLFLVLHTVIQLVSCKKLQDYCLEFICDNPGPFFSSKDFLSFDKEVFLELIKRDDLGIEEIEVWEHLIEWGVHRTPGIRQKESFDPKDFSKKDFNDLKKTLDPFIPHIRFYNVSLKDFYCKVRPYQQVLPRSLVEEVMSFLITGMEPKQKILPEKTPMQGEPNANLPFFIAELVTGLMQTHFTKRLMAKDKRLQSSR
ncbi:11819_t:CDS:2, partial [Acaulospora colombiana]